jgi:hypothetical protein
MPVPDPNDSTAVKGPLHCGISIRLMSARGQWHALPRRSISVRFTPVSGIDSRSQALPSRANSGREQVQQTAQLFDHLVVNGK